MPPQRTSRATAFARAAALLVPLLLLGAVAVPRGRTVERARLAPLRVAGSNYPFYSVDGYLRDPTESTWFAPGTLRPVVGRYDEDSATVLRQLEQMYAAGQRRIALVVWYDDLSNDARLRDRPVYGHAVNASTGALLPRHAESLRAIVRHLRTLGYEELVVRFAGQGQSRPKEWKRWNEDAYERNRRFIWSTITLVDSARGPLPVLYDLDIEGGGIDLGQERPYVRRLWRDYLASFPAENSVGFSLAASSRLDWGLGGRRLATLIADFDSVGRRPPSYAVDVYEWPARSLAGISRSLQAQGAGGAPVVILESYHDDVETCEAVADARAAGALDIVAVYQWPLDRGATARHVSMDFARSYRVWRALAATGDGTDASRCASAATSVR